MLQHIQQEGEKRHLMPGFPMTTMQTAHLSYAYTSPLEKIDDFRTRLMSLVRPSHEQR